MTIGARTLAALLLCCAIPGSTAAKKISRAELAFAAGRNLGLAAIGHQADAPADAVARLFRKAERLSRGLGGGALPGLPEKTGQRTRDAAAVLEYLLDGPGKTLQVRLQARHGARAAALYEVGMKSCVLAIIYVPGDALATSASLGIERAALRARLPEAVWSPLVSKVRARAPLVEVKDAIFELHRALENGPIIPS